MNLVVAVNFLSAAWFVWRMKRSQCVGFLTLSFASLIIFAYPLAGIVTAALVVAINPLRNVIDEILYRKSRDEWLKQWLNQIILEMKNGRGFKNALANTLKEAEKNELRRKMSLWLQRDGISALAEDPWWKKIESQLSQIETTQHKAVEKLIFWRDRLKQESNFHRRLGQVTMQIRAQATLLLLFYLALLVNLLARKGLSGHIVLVLFSSALFFLGLGLIFRLGRRIKWNF